MFDQVAGAAGEDDVADIAGHRAHALEVSGPAMRPNADERQTDGPQVFI
ncbi:hypothetical protein [Dankookia sp. P2]